MPQAANLSLTVGSTAVVFNVGKTQVGDKPSIFLKAHSTGVFDFADTISHSVNSGPVNRNVKLGLTQRNIANVAGSNMVVSTNGCTINFNFPKNGTQAERLNTVDTIIALLTKEKANVASAEIYF